MEHRFDWWSFLGGATFAFGSLPKLWPEISLHTMGAVPPVVVDFPLRLIATILLAFFGGFAGMVAKDFYLYLKKRFTK